MVIAPSQTNIFVLVIVKIFEKRKIWDVDNRTVKPIQDGLIHGGVIRDDGGIW